MESQNRIGKLPEHNSTLNAFLSSKGLEFGLTYFKEICSTIILNHSIHMSDGQVMANLQSWGQREKLDNISLGHTHVVR